MVAAQPRAAIVEVPGPQLNYNGRLLDYKQKWDQFWYLQESYLEKYMTDAKNALLNVKARKCKFIMGQQK